MEVRSKVLHLAFLIAAIAAMSVTAPAVAKSRAAGGYTTSAQRYIVIFEDPPLAAYDGRVIQTPELDVDTMHFAATANRFTGARKLDVNAPDSKKYLKFLDERFDKFRGESALRLGHQLKTIHRYRNALNGFATELNDDEVRVVRNMPGVASVEPDRTFHLHTDSGPNWIGADKIHDGTAGPYPATGGEGIVIGIIDTGINWNHPSFADAGEGSLPGWDFVNPFGKQLGLCSKSEVLCNDKLVGVYDFVQNAPDTPENEENTNGKDNNGHGSHVASIAAGNPLDVTLNGQPVVMAGVAPNANIVSYRVCFIADASNADDDGCQGSAILSAIDQAITDQVDAVNYSIGADVIEDPWQNGTSTRAFLNLRAAGIFVATSAGNAGPYAYTIGSPANAPWIVSVGNATHDRVFGSVLENLSGGDTTPPGPLFGASYTDGIGIRKIVYAGDYGFPLCGTGEPQSGAACADNTGLSNPFSANTFNGEIVVCDRGTYGRVEKGKNLQLAGAGGYILANTDDPELQDTVADDHCLPAVHLDRENSDTLRAWLDSGTGQQGSLSGFSIFHIPEAGDRLASSSSRGPGLPPTENILKPDLIAPGTSILGAWKGDGTDFLIISGTSMASPHVAGGAALVKAVHPDWTPPMIASALSMTATPEQATNHDGSPATPHERGSGRPRLDQAVNAGLYLNETESGFLAADPRIGGNPQTLNLPGLVDSACFNSCEFKRTVTDLAGGASWSVSTDGFANGVNVTVTPVNFILTDGASRQLTVNIDLTQSEVIGDWIYGEVILSSDGLPDAVFTVAVFAYGGTLPSQWTIQTDQDSGSKNFSISGLVEMPDATFTSGGLVVPTETVKLLAEDPTNDDPYDGGAGVMTVLHDVPEGTLLLHAETLDTTADDVDLYVGRDTNGDGQAQLEEEVCASLTESKLETCDLVNPEAGTYWILAQNWAANLSQDAVTVKSAVVSSTTPSPLTATGNGIVANGASQTVRLSWDNVSAVPGQELIGAVGIGTRRESPADIGIVPVTFTKTGVAAPQTLVLMDGVSRGVTVGSLKVNDHVYFDVPEGAELFTVSTNLADSSQNKSLKLELYRVGFDTAFTKAPFVTPPDTDGPPLFTATGTSDAGPALTVPAGSAAPGRWFAVLTNFNGDPAAVEIRLDMSFAGTPFPMSSGLWQPVSRPDLSQGFDYAQAGDYRGFLWYTYDENGAPAWYLAAGPNPAGNVWVAALGRYTNDGAEQKFTNVGYVSVTTLGEQDNIFSFVLFGEEGSDRMVPSSPPLCPTVNNAKQSYTGTWSRAAVGVGGSSVLVNAVSQGYLHYIYDANGNPVWLLGANVTDGLPHAEVPLLQFSGYCAVCSGATPTSQEVGVLTLDYADDSNMTWNLDYVLMPPLSGSVDRTDVAEKLTDPLVCQ